MSGTQPHCDVIAFVEYLRGYLGKPFAGLYLDALHAEDKGLVLYAKLFKLLHKSPECLGSDGYNNQVAVLDITDIRSQFYAVSEA